jgi:DNA repair exonuclease SbcCD ATPase subunit
MDNYNLASLCYKWIERYEKIVKERDQAIKERDVERLAHKADNNEAKRMIDEARMWASKMMAERDKYNGWYTELLTRFRKTVKELDEWKKKYEDSIISKPGVAGHNHIYRATPWYYGTSKDLCIICGKRHFE